MILFIAQTANGDSPEFDYTALTTLTANGIFNGARIALLTSVDGGATWQPQDEQIHRPISKNLILEESDPPIKVKARIVDAGPTTSITLIKGAITP